MIFKDKIKNWWSKYKTKFLLFFIPIITAIITGVIYAKNKRNIINSDFTKQYLNLQSGNLRNRAERIRANNNRIDKSIKSTTAGLEQLERNNTRIEEREQQIAELSSRAKTIIDRVRSNNKKPAD